MVLAEGQQSVLDRSWPSTCRCDDGAHGRGAGLKGTRSGAAAPEHADETARPSEALRQQVPCCPRLKMRAKDGVAGGTFVRISATFDHGVASSLGVCRRSRCSLWLVKSKLQRHQRVRVQEYKSDRKRS